MFGGPAKPVAVDGTDLGVRLASVPAGVRVTLIVCAAAGVDVFFYAAPDRRVALAAILVAAVLGAIGMGLLPWERILRSRWREPAFLGWSLSNVITIGAFNLIDHSPNSALSLMFFIPIVFVSTTYPLRSVIIVSAASIAAYFGVALASGSTLDFVIMFAAVLGSTALMGAWQAHNHDRVRAALARVSRTDPLTGCLNRRGFEERAEAAVRAASASGSPLAVILVDLDGFKQVNDTGGHAAGDAVLKGVADRLATVARAGDEIGRLGGDEFAVLLCGTDEPSARAAARRLEDALADVSRASIGVAVMPQHGTELDTLIGWADRRLYETKLRRRAAGHRRTSDPIELTALGIVRAEDYIA
jgi:diguanylate cyclase (GGDEF)-like protein